MYKNIETAIQNLPIKINTEQVQHLIDTYYKTIEAILKVKRSYYSNILNYQSYVYWITNKKTLKHYIGVRYTKDKYSNDLLEDLKIYQSSSTDENFKQDMKDNPNNYCFYMIETFNTEFEALNFEALLHNIFEVDTNINFYNFTKENFVNCELYTKEIKLYNIEGNEVILNYTNRKSICEKYNIDLNSSFYNLMKDIGIDRVGDLFISYNAYMMYTKIYTLYWKENNIINSISYSLSSDIYKNNTQIRAIHNNLFLNGIPLNKTQWGYSGILKLAKEKSLPKYDFLEYYYYNNTMYIKFYFYCNNILNEEYLSYECIIKRLKQNYPNKSSRSIRSMCKQKEVFSETPTIHSINNIYYMDKNAALNNNRCYTFYYLDYKHNVHSKDILAKDCNSTIGNNWTGLINGNRNVVNGYSLNPKYAGIIKDKNVNIDKYISNEIWTTELKRPIKFNTKEEFINKFNTKVVSTIVSRCKSIWTYEGNTYSIDKNLLFQATSKFLFINMLENCLEQLTIKEFSIKYSIPSSNIHKIFNSSYNTNTVNGFSIYYLSGNPVLNTDKYYEEL